MGILNQKTSLINMDDMIEKFASDRSCSVYAVGKYVVGGSITETLRYSLNTQTGEEGSCQILPLDDFSNHMNIRFKVGYHDHLLEIKEICHRETDLFTTEVYIFFAREPTITLYSYVTIYGKFEESKALSLFAQVVKLVSDCYDKGVILSPSAENLVFSDKEETQLALIELEKGMRHDSYHDLSHNYFAIDLSLGRILYLMLVGDYPKNITDLSANSLPDHVSYQTKYIFQNIICENEELCLSPNQILQCMSSEHMIE